MKLGKIQIMALRSLQDYGGWPGGWTLDNWSTTTRVLDSLARRGLVERRESTMLDNFGKPWVAYEINDAGRRAVAPSPYKVAPPHPSLANMWRPDDAETPSA